MSLIQRLMSLHGHGEKVRCSGWLTSAKSQKPLLATPCMNAPLPGKTRCALHPKEANR